MIETTIQAIQAIEQGTTFTEFDTAILLCAVYPTPFYTLCTKLRDELDYPIDVRIVAQHVVKLYTSGYILVDKVVIATEDSLYMMDLIKDPNERRLLELAYQEIFLQELSQAMGLCIETIQGMVKSLIKRGFLSCA